MEVKAGGDCLACCDPIVGKTGFQCEKCGTRECVACFGNFVQFSCENYLAEGRIPLQCPIPTCDYFVPDAITRQLITSELWELYLKTQIRKALCNNGGDLVITCSVCSEYTEIIQPVEADFWRSRQLLKQVALETLVTEEMNKIRDAHAKKIDETIDELRTKIAKYEANHSEKDPEWLQAYLKGGLENIARQVDRSIPPHASVKRSIGTDDVTSFVESHKYDSKLSDADFERLCDVYFWICVNKPAQKTVFPWEYVDTDKLNQKIVELQRKKVDGPDCSAYMEKYKKQCELKLSQSDDSAVQMEIGSKGLLSAFTSLFQRSNTQASSGLQLGKVNASTQYFVCRKEGCAGAFCLKCETFLKKKDLPKHVCAFTQVDALYYEVLQILAEKSVQTCPKCGFVGRKDYACTHITCDKCKARFCYICRKMESELVGGFSAHNEWTLSRQSGVCPMYLQYKYGDQGPNGSNRMDGDAGKALTRFHEELQKAAIEAKQKKEDPVRWQEMVDKYFPKGIFYDPSADDEKKEDITVMPPRHHSLSGLNPDLSLNINVPVLVAPAMNVEELFAQIDNSLEVEALPDLHQRRLS